MAIVRSDPPDFAHANVVQIDSDASENIDAIHEIDDWAARHGFARVSEYWLRRIVTRDGRRVFRGICYRLTDEERQSAEAASAEHEKALASMPATAHRMVDR